MNQYIITEEVAEIIETALESDEHCKKCPYEGGGFNQGALSLLRECPYQSERDKVLDTDSVLAVLKKRYRNEMAILDYIEMIECEVMALRQEGEP